MRTQRIPRLHGLEMKKIGFDTKQTVFDTKQLFYRTELYSQKQKSTFYASETGYSIAEKTVGEAPTIVCNKTTIQINSGKKYSVTFYVADNCENDLAVLLSSGIQPAVASRDRSPLANPSILSSNGC
jgi:hypothetical protein